jgi:type I restriction enzyme S subunit
MVYVMNSPLYRLQVEQAISGADGMANNLPISELKTFLFAVPPKHEAALIAEQLTNQTSELTTAIARLEREIELLREYRTRLVADVVTGKLDVRAVAAGLPEEEGVRAPEEEEGTDEAGEELEEVEG